MHFDSSLYSGDLFDIDDAVCKECQILENLIGQHVEIVSFHRPVQSLQGLDRFVGGRDHVYRPKYFENIEYCSDSRGQWNDFPLEQAAFEAGTAIQVLTHPIWWVYDNVDTVNDKLNYFANVRAKILKQELARNCSAYSFE